MLPCPPMGEHTGPDTYNLADVWEAVVGPGARPGRRHLWRRQPHLRRARGTVEPTRPPPRGPRRRARRPRRHLPDQRSRVPRGDVRRLQAAGGADQRELPLRRRRAALPVRRRRTWSAVVHGSSSPTRSRRSRPRCRRIRFTISVSDGPALPPATTRTRSRPQSPDRDFGPRSERRPLRHLHRRHHRHAQGRGVAAGGRVLRLHRWRRPDAPQRSGRRAGRAARPHHRLRVLRLPARAADARRRAVDRPVVAVTAAAASC